jgi:hypothetical protein
MCLKPYGKPCCKAAIHWVIGHDGPQDTLGRKFRYRIRLLALDEPIEAGPGLVKRSSQKAVEEHVLAEQSSTQLGTSGLTHSIL